MATSVQPGPTNNDGERVLNQLLASNGPSSSPCMNCGQPVVTSVCHTCHQLLCGVCTDQHKSSPIILLRNHDIKTLTTATEVRIAALALLESQACAKHKMALDFWSIEHGKAVCATCFAETKPDKPPTLLKAHADILRTTKSVSTLEKIKGSIGAKSGEQRELRAHVKATQSRSQELVDLVKMLQEINVEVEKAIERDESKTVENGGALLKLRKLHDLVISLNGGAVSNDVFFIKLMDTIATVHGEGLSRNPQGNATAGATGVASWTLPSDKLQKCVDKLAALMSNCSSRPQEARGVHVTPPAAELNGPMDLPRGTLQTAALSMEAHAQESFVGNALLQHCQVVLNHKNGLLVQRSTNTGDGSGDEHLRSSGQEAPHAIAGSNDVGSVDSTVGGGDASDSEDSSLPSGCGGGGRDGLRKRGRPSGSGTRRPKTPKIT